MGSDKAETNFSVPKLFRNGEEDEEEGSEFLCITCETSAYFSAHPPVFWKEQCAGQKLLLRLTAIF